MKNQQIDLQRVNVNCVLCVDIVCPPFFSRTKNEKKNFEETQKNAEKKPKHERKRKIKLNFFCIIASPIHLSAHIFFHFIVLH